MCHQQHNPHNYMRPLHDRGAKEKCAKILLIEAGNAVNI